MLFKRLISHSTLLAVTAVGAPGGTIPIGSVLVATGTSEVQVFSPTGTLLETLNDGSGATYTTGMVFDGAGNLYVTNFDSQNISKFDSNGNLVRFDLHDCVQHS